MAKKATKPAYDLHPSVEMMTEWIASLSKKTGRSLEQWVKFIRTEGPKDEKAARAWLKDKLGQGTNTAWWMAERAFAKPGAKFDDDPETYLELAPKYVEEQYPQKKAALRPIYERLLTLVRGLGKDIKVCPCKTMVPIYREHVIANITPSTMKRMDLGLCLIPQMKAGKKLPARLIDTGGFAKKDRITHRIELASVDAIDEFVGKWLMAAYENDTVEKKVKALKLK